MSAGDGGYWHTDGLYHQDADMVEEHKNPNVTFNEDVDIIQIPAEGLGRPTPPRRRGRRTKWKEEDEGPQSLVGK